VTEGDLWPAEGESGPSAVVLVRGLSPGELAVRMGCDPAPARAGITADDVMCLLGAWHRPGGYRDGLIRTGGSAGWSFAAEYGDSSCRGRPAEVSGGTEALRLEPPGEDPSAEPADFC
jgi:hypothetical protein